MKVVNFTWLPNPKYKLIFFPKKFGILDAMRKVVFQKEYITVSQIGMDLKLPCKALHIIQTSYIRFLKKYNSDAVSALLDHAPYLSTTTSSIVEASIRGYKDIVHMLLDYGVNPNLEDREKHTCGLHEATRFARFKLTLYFFLFSCCPFCNIATLNKKNIYFNVSLFLWILYPHFYCIYIECQSTLPKIYHCIDTQIRHCRSYYIHFI